MKKKKWSAKPIRDLLKKENDYMKMLYKVSPLFVSASAWLIVSIDNKPSKQNLTSYKHEPKSGKLQINLPLADHTSQNLIYSN